jgi:hypothetical protein
MKQWPYYTNVYYIYTHGSFNIDNYEIYNISFVEIIIVRPKN